MADTAPLGVLCSAVISGIESTLVTVEVHRDDGIPSETIVGLAGTAVRESLERIRGAFRSSDIYMEPRRTTVNLAPADHPKGGSGLDLPIALAMLIADETVPATRLENCLCLGELQLDGSTRAVPGVLPAALAARSAAVRRLIVPLANAAEAAAVPGFEVIAVRSLRETVDWCLGADPPAPPPPSATESLAVRRIGLDLVEVAGNLLARRALELAAAGGHHLLMVGLPGAGKTMLARALPGIMPTLLAEASLAASAIYSAVGMLPDGELLVEAPLRAPHHSVTAVGLIGGGVPLRPGEASLAHCGVLFLDELPEFRRSVLECLRQPLEDGLVSLVRGGRAASLPARFQLVAAMNPCPCGNGAASDACRCTLGQIRGYWRRLSGPLLDRIDLVVAVDPVSIDDLIEPTASPETSAEVRLRVEAARRVQHERIAALEIDSTATTSNEAPIFTNASIPSSLLPEVCRLSPSQRRRARDEADRLGISARGWHRVLRVARTIADLDGRDELRYTDLAEAFQYRRHSQELVANHPA